MKHKVADLEGALLDAAVAKALGHKWRIDRVHSADHRSQRDMCSIEKVHGWGKRIEDFKFFEPSRPWGWADGGPIIERERLAIEPLVRSWLAVPADENGRQISEHEQVGPTPLIAAMRAYVASKFGDEVEL